MLPHYHSNRKSKLRWLVMLSTMPLLGVVTAFGLAPKDPASLENTPMTALEIALPELTPQPTEAQTFWRSEQVQRGDTVAELLRRLKVSDPQASEFLRRAEHTESLRKLKVGKQIQVETDAGQKLISLRFLNNDGQQVVIKKQNGQFTLKEQKPQLETRLVVRNGVISHSLFGATNAAGIPFSVASQVAEIFSGDIDYHRDLRKNDTFTVIYEKTYSNGELVSNGRVRAAEFVNKGNRYRAVYFSPDEEQSGSYYRPDGKSMKRAFLRYPIPFARISSKFTKSRFHPILKRWRSHKGVDFAASTGTPIRTTGDGVVHRVERQRGYGKVVMVKHRNRYITLYAHMSRFAKDIRPGKKVEQGEVIGYVGSTGLATGPHLHYEFRLNGKQRDPMKIVLPNVPPVEKKHMTQFMSISNDMVARMDFVHDTKQLASQ